MLVESGLLIKGVSETIKNKGKEQKRGFLSMLLDTLVANFIRHLLNGRVAERTIRRGQYF